MRYIWLKRLVTVCLLLYCARAFAGDGKRSFVISGQLKNVKEGKIFLMQSVSLAQRVKNPGAFLSDSTTIVNGKFSFKGSLKDDVVKVCFIMKTPVSEAVLSKDPVAGYHERYFYLSPGNIVVSGKSIDDIEFVGTKDMLASSKLGVALKEQRAAYYEAFRKMLMVSAQPGGARMADSVKFYSMQIDSLRKVQKDIESAFIRQHPSALLNVAILKERDGLAEISTAKEVGDLVDALSPELRSRADMVAISKRMKQLATLVIGNPALDFSMPDSTGRMISLSSYHGKYLLVEFWASWCGPCRAQVPYLKKSYAAFKDRNFEILGVSLDDNREKWLRAVHEESLPWPQISDIKGFDSKVISQYGITGIPLNFLLDTNGVIIGRDLRNDDLSERLSAVLSTSTKTEQGVMFDHQLTWEEIKAKAKAENKYIFADCYASWCAPCLKMLKEVFPRKDMGDFFNDKFICIKLQLDKTAKDDDYIKMWYEDVTKLATGIPSLPTFLYFSPDGKLVHRIPGTESAESLIAKSAEVLDPERQYYTQLAKFEQSDKKDTAMMRMLATASTKVLEKENMARFSNMYLNAQRDFLSRENILFMNGFVSSSKNKGFEIFLQHPHEVDKVLGEGTATERVQGIIFNEELMPLLSNAGRNEPDWKAMQSTIAAKYPTYAEPVVTKFQAQYYMGKQNWSGFEKVIIKYMKKYGNDVRNPEDLNVFARTIFENCSGKKSLQEALKWSKRSVEGNDNPRFMYTYANLLYKTGETTKAIAMLEKAVVQVSGEEKDNYNMTLEKMRKGEVTWKIQ